MGRRRADPARPGYRRRRPGRGFAGLDEHGRRLTDPGELARIRPSSGRRPGRPPTVARASYVDFRWRDRYRRGEPALVELLRESAR
jgi:hypothetical protein